MLGKIYSYAFSAGATKTLPGGVYLRVLTADAAVTLTFYDESGQALGDWVGVLGGFGIDATYFSEKVGKTVARFGRVDVYSATAQTVDIAVSRVPVDYDRSAGSVSVTNAPTITPFSLATCYVRNSASAALGTIVAPASNVNGIRFLRAVISVAGAENVRIMAKSSAPAGWADATANTLLAGCEAAGSIVTDNPILIPAGLGLYEQAGGGAIVTRVFAEYQVL